MNEQLIVSLIGSLGFPIVMCLMMFKYMEEEQKTHREESNSLRDAVNKLEIAITKLTERLNLGDSDDKAS